MLTYILSLDVKLTNLLYNFLPHNLFFDYFFAFLSLKGASVLIWTVIIIAFTIIEERQDKKFILYFLASFTISAVILSSTLKIVFQRPRPLAIMPQIVTNCPTDFSFPSSHATGAFAAAVILSYFDKKRKYFYYAVAVLISLSRIYLHCHYLLDIIAGALLGSSVSYVILHLQKNIRQKI